MACGRRPAVIGHYLDLVAGDATLGISLVDGDLESVLDFASIVRVGARQRQGNAELDRLLLSLRGDDAARSRQRHDTGESDKIEGTARLLGLLHGLHLR